MADTERIQVADWLHDEYVELQTDPTFVAEQLILDIMVQIGTVMEEKGLTQKELADALDISSSAMSQLLSGDQNVSIKRLVKVALALGMRWEAPQLVQYEEPNIERVETSTRVDVGDGNAGQHSRGFSQKTKTWGDAISYPTRLSIEGEPVAESVNDDEEQLLAA